MEENTIVVFIRCMYELRKDDLDGLLCKLKHKDEVLKLQLQNLVALQTSYLRL